MCKTIMEKVIKNLWEDVKGDLNKRKAIFSITRFSIVKIVILLKLISRFNMESYKIPEGLYE